jgi:hypothetical protein
MFQLPVLAELNKIGKSDITQGFMLTISVYLTTWATWDSNPEPTD